MWRRSRDRRRLSGIEDASMRQRLLLITGTPGTGKRAVGNYLAERSEFLHVDFDSPGARSRFLEAGKEGLRAELAASLEAGRDIVVTWGSRSSAQLSHVRLMQAVGFEWIWFDSDRGAASPAFLTRFASRTGPRSRPRFVDTFAADGSFRPLEAVTAELLAPGSRAAAQTVREPVVTRLRSSALRPVLAAGLALAATATAAVGGYLVASHGSAGPATHGAAAAHSVQAKPAALPRQGILVPGRSLAGVRLGDSAASVRTLWGRNFAVCRGCGAMTWLYLYSTDDPLGAGVKFRHGRVTAVFTLGGPRGWRTARGLRVGQLLDPFNDPGNASKWIACQGYGAKSVQTGDSITSILTIGQSIYGFALTRPSEPVCQ
jgi:hypothetical protein